MSVGEANGNYYSVDELTKGIANTVWDKNTLSLFTDHTPYTTGNWAGRVENPHMEGNDVKGDLYFYDLNLINKLEGGAQFGISPELIGNLEDGNVIDIEFQNFSVVFEPACKTTYLNSKKNEKQILIEQAISPEKGYFYFVDSDGNICQRKLQDKGYVNMVDKTKKLEDETKETETNETETSESKVESMLSEVLEAQKSISKRLNDLETKKPEEKKDEKKEKPDEEEKEEKEEKKEVKPKELTKKEKVPEEEEEEEPKPEEAKLSADMYAALSLVDSNYAEFLREYVSEHKSEGTLVELMEKSSIAFKASKKALVDEDKKQELQENKSTVSQPDGTDNKTEITLGDVDRDMADFLLERQSGLTAGELK